MNTNTVCDNCLLKDSRAFWCAVQGVRWSFNEFAETLLSETPIIRRLKSVQNIKFDNRCYNYIKL